ncbi:hypothetical protein L798_05484 [Zootermopsis nevadensis]|uniref:Uncharacterized protein n=1 Tax=Zootermopsis nevadensis TaxID=136037 RepID=A0A067RJ15_ZOONE|nr:hypothetical protein L798_05484 [Zootermopsis nevadensis]
MKMWDPGSDKALFRQTRGRRRAACGEHRAQKIQHIRTYKHGRKRNRKKVSLNIMLAAILELPPLSVFGGSQGSPHCHSANHNKAETEADNELTSDTEQCSM